MESKGIYQTQRQKTINTILLILIPLWGAFAFLRSQQEGAEMQMMIDLSLMAGALFSFILLKRFPAFHRFITRFILISAIVAFLFTLYNQAGDAKILIWGITIVLMSFLLTGRHEGWFWSLLTIASTLIMVLLSPHYLYRLDAIALLTFMGNALLIALFASWYEYLSEQEIERIQNEQSRLESLVKYRTRSLQEANAKAMKALRDAQEASKAKSTFLANVSHEIRTPLNAISGFITMMLKEEQDPLKRKQMQTIHEASEILTQLISDILDLSKIESGNMEIRMSEFDPRSLFFSVAELFQSRAAEKYIEFQIEFCRDGDEVGMVRSDPIRIRQVLSNLLSNAIKFTPKAGSVHILACYRDGWLHFEVRDTGIGMSPADQERIFRPFQQAHERDANIQGTGLGLTISREIAERLKGRLEVRSTPGKGSTFTFAIPAQKISTYRRPSNQIQAQQPKELPKTIEAELLVVEDVRANQMFITMVLDKHKIRYDIANDGVEAVELFRNKRYDLILMDENMPRMGGVEATQKIRELEKERGDDPTPIIALTANAVVGDRERLLAVGMNEYISKPVNPDKLIRTIATLLNRWS